MNFTARLKLQVEAQHHYFVARVLVQASRPVEPIRAITLPTIPASSKFPSVLKES
jgi:hypothetical protein